MHAVNGIYVVQGEASAVVAQMRKFRHILMHHHQTALFDHGAIILLNHFYVLDMKKSLDLLIRNFSDLCDVLNTVFQIFICKIFCHDCTIHRDSNFTLINLMPVVYMGSETKISKPISTVW